MLPTSLHTFETTDRAEDVGGRRRSASGSAAVFLRELGRAIATPAGDTRGHVRPYCPGLLERRDDL
jgi:hypothetical protein